MEFVPLAERIAEAVLESSPATAAFVGDHRFDAELPDYSPDGVVAQTAMLRAAIDALSQVDADALAAAEKVDHAILSHLVDRQLFELTELRQHEWNPLSHNPGALLNGLIARPFAPAAERFEAIKGRLAKVADSLAVARSVLRDCPAIHLETAAGQFAGAAALVRDEVPALGQSPLIEEAANALEEFGAWCATRAREGDGRDPRLGRRLWDAKLWYTLDTELSSAEVLKRAWQNLDDVSEQLREVSAQITGGPVNDATVRQALDQLAQDRPNNDTIIALAQQTMTETTAFVAEHDLVTLIDEQCVIKEMPEFARGVAVAYCDPPGALETASVPTFYCIAPTPSGWSAERVDSFYREYNNHMIKNLTVHEAMPGHFLQLAHSRRFRGSSRARLLGFSSPMVEGWAVYAEEVMTGHGYGGLPVKAQQLKMQLRMTINALLDQLVHCEEMSEADGMALMLDRGFQEEGEAAGKWRRALLSSAQLSTYFVGYAEVSAIGRARPAGVALRGWHDAMLAQGSPAPRHLRGLLTA